MKVLYFLNDFDLSPTYNLWTADMAQVPTQPGAYVLLAASGTKFLYPNGSSPVFYVGQASNLQKRLLTHRKYSLEAKSDRKLPLYYPRYEYAAVFGCRFALIRTWQGFSAKALEEVVLAHFAKRFRSFPIANGAGSWNRIV
ncbi:MAG: hypothetical protein HYZ49_07085 [Chloroflexi bacterium]|nr:hypothetical protein [Chloroflexota bacterium]